MPGSWHCAADPSVRLRARAALVVGIVLGALVLREGWREISKVRSSSATIDTRYASFIGPARGERRIGTLPEADAGAVARVRRVELQYALAPSLIIDGTAGVRLVVAWAESDAQLDQLATRHRWKVLARAADGCTLFQKSKP